MPDPLDDLDALLAADAGAAWRADGDLVRRGTGTRVCEATPATARLIAALRNAAPDLLAVARAAASSGFRARSHLATCGCDRCVLEQAVAALRARLREGGERG